MRHNPFALFGPTPARPPSSHEASQTSATPAECPPASYGQNFVRLSTGGSSLLGPSKLLSTPNGCPPGPPISAPTPTPRTPLQQLAPPPHGPAPDPPQTSQRRLLADNAISVSPAPFSTPTAVPSADAGGGPPAEEYANFKRLSELTDAGGTEFRPAGRGKRGRSVSAPAHSAGAPSQRLRAAPSPRSWSAEDTATLAPRAGKGKGTRGRWRVRNGQRCFVVGRRQLRGQQAWLAYQQQQKAPKGKGKAAVASYSPRVGQRAASSSAARRRSSAGLPPAPPPPVPSHPGSARPARRSSAASSATAMPQPP
eukprot:EG_transcript_20500